MKRLIALALLSLFASFAAAETLEQRIAKVAKGIDGVTGVAAIHLASGRRVVVNGNQTFPMASVYKFPTAIVVLRNVDAGKLELDDQVRRLLHLMVAESDNPATEKLIRLCGGNDAATRELGTAGITIDRQAAATPVALADLLARFWIRELGLSKSSHDLLVKIMEETSTGPNRIRAGVAKGTVVAHKTGTWKDVINDVGVIDGSVAIAVFTKGGKATKEQREKVIAGITKTVYDEFTRGR